MTEEKAVATAEKPTRRKRITNKELEQRLDALDERVSADLETAMNLARNTSEQLEQAQQALIRVTGQWDAEVNTTRQAIMQIANRLDIIATAIGGVVPPSPPQAE